MAIVPMVELLLDARKKNYAVGYFESWDLYSLQATVRAAEDARSPLILGVGGLSAHHGWLRSVGIAGYFAAIDILARQASVPIATLFNEGDSIEESKIAIDAGYGAVMMHTEGWSWDRLIADTAEVVRLAHQKSVAVEGEVGALPEIVGEKIDSSRASLTTVEEATRFVSETSVDCLAVAVGNVHFVTTDYVPSIDTQRIRDIDDAVHVPLVMHGGSGTPDDQMRQAIEAGITKINLGTKLKYLYGKKLKTILGEENWDPNKSIGSHLPEDWSTRAAETVYDEVSRLIRVFSSEGKA